MCLLYPYDPFFTKIQTSELTFTRHKCFRKGLVIGRQSDLGFPKLQINIKASCALENQKNF